MCCFLSLQLSLYSNFGGFSSVIWCRRLLEPRMLKRLFGGNSFSRIIDENLLQKVEEVSAEFVVVWDDFLLLVSFCSQYWEFLGLHPTASWP